MKALIIGAAVSGAACARLLNKKGYEVYLTDAKAIDDKEILQKIFQLLREHKFIAANTSLDAFYYWMGCGSSQNTQDIEPINWIAKLKDLGVWVNVFFGNENKKWEKTIRCFRINGEEIKKRSITTAVDKHDNVDELEHIFKSWKE